MSSIFDLKKIGAFLLILYVVTFTNEHINAFRNIFLYTSFLAIIYFSATKIGTRIFSFRWLYLAVLMGFLSIVIYAAVINHDDPYQGLEFFRKTYFKGFVLAVGVPLFVTASTSGYFIYAMLLASLSIGISEGMRYISGEADYFNHSKITRHAAHYYDYWDSALVGVYWYERKFWVKMIALSGIILFTILVIGTGTRSGWFSLVVGFATTYFLLNLNNNLVKNILWVMVRVLVIVVGVYVIAPDGSQVKNKFEQGIESTERTQKIFPAYASIVMDGPAFGYGYIRHIEHNSLIVSSDEIPHVEVALRHGPHNQFLLNGVYFGWVGMLTYITVLVMTLLVLVRGALFSNQRWLRATAAIGAGMLNAEYVVRSMTELVPEYWLGLPIGIAILVQTESKKTYQEGLVSNSKCNTLPGVECCDEDPNKTISFEH